jgi:hypothetical protein
VAKSALPASQCTGPRRSPLHLDKPLRIVDAVAATCHRTTAAAMMVPAKKTPGTVALSQKGVCAGRRL